VLFVLAGTWIGTGRKPHFPSEMQLYSLCLKRGLNPLIGLFKIDTN